MLLALQRGLVLKSLMAVILCTMNCIAEEEMPAELVNRRHRGDIYHKYNSSDGSISCSEGNNLTYLVDERQCVDQQQLLNGRVDLSIIINKLSVCS